MTDRWSPQSNAQTIVSGMKQSGVSGMKQSGQGVALANLPLGYQIGNYQIVAVLGEGGMGKVFLGKQDKPVERKVAIKVIRQQFPDSDILARFQCERQAVASLTHPNIAKLLDVGTTSDGRPFFAMELIDGLPITEFCDRHQLSIRDRLDLFCQACDALAHAHSRGLIHRDIKPSNLLVERENGKNFLKIIDFGLAKFVEDSCPFPMVETKTLAGQVLGTPQYMSPEQALGADDRLDIRSDVFSLGVILFEVLTGSTPIKDEENKGIQYLLGCLENFQSVHPSVRVAEEKSTQTKGGGSSIASSRGSSVEGLCQEIKGDLDWITLKALEKDQERRYRSCNELSDDIRRYLNQQPVSARPPSFSYLAQKYIRRNRLAVAFASSVVLFLCSILIAGWFLAILAMNQAKTEKKAAKEIGAVNKKLNSALADLKKSSKRVAAAERRSDSALTYLTTSFDQMDSSSTGRNLSASDAVWLTYQRLKSDQGMDTIGQVQFRTTLAKALNGLGQNEKALTVIEDALQISKDLGREKNQLYFSARKLLHAILLDSGQHDRLAKELEESSKYLEQFGDSNAVHTAIFEIQRALLIQETGNRTEVKALIPKFEKSLAQLEKESGQFERDILRYKSRLARVYQTVGYLEKYEQVLSQILAVQRKHHFENHPSVVLTKIRLLQNKARTGNINANLKEIRSSISVLEDLYSENHPDILFIYLEYLKLCNLDFQNGEVKSVIEKILPRFQKVFGEDHFNTMEVLQEKASVLALEKKFLEAVEIQKKVVDALKKSSSSRVDRTLGAEVKLANLYVEFNQFQKAIPYYQSAIKHYKEKGVSNPNFSDAITGVALAYRKMGQFSKAKELSRHVLEYRKKHLHKDQLPIGQAYYSLGLTCIGTKEYGEAIGYLDRAIEVVSENFEQYKDAFAGKVLSECHFQKSIVFYRQRMFKKSSDSLARALEVQKEVITNDLPLVRRDDKSRYYRILMAAKNILASNRQFPREIDPITASQFLWNLQKGTEDYHTFSTAKLADIISEGLIGRDEYGQALDYCRKGREIIKGIRDNDPKSFEAVTSDFIFLEREGTIHCRMKSESEKVEIQNQMLDLVEKTMEEFKSKRNRAYLLAFVRFCKGRQDVWNGKPRKRLLEIESKLRG